MLVTQTAIKQDEWFLKPKPKNNAKYRLFCFSYAGGNISTYYHWEKEMGPNIELNLVQMPGRGSRFAADQITDMDLLVEQIFQAIRGQLDKPFAFFGHSLGSRVAFRLLMELAIHKLPQPLHFFASGSRAPHIDINYLPSASLTDDKFIVEIAKMGGTPEALIENPDMMEIALPIIKADFQLASSFVYKGNDCFDSELTLFTGKNDPLVTQESVLAWQNYFRGFNGLNTIEGDHFFIESQSQEVVTQIVTTLIFQ